MKRLAWILLAACGSHDAGKPPDPSLTLSYAAPPVGLQMVEESELDTTLTLAKGSDASALDEDERELSHVTVLAVTGDAITQIRIQYDTKETSQRVGGDATIDKSPLDGHTYTVTFADGALTASRDDGAAITDDEKAALIEDHHDLGKQPAVAHMLTAHTWKEGEQVTLAAGELDGLGMGDASVKPVSGTITLTGTGAGVATFATEVTLVKDDDKGKVETHVQGTMRVEIAGARPVEITTTSSASGELRGAMAGTTVTGSTKGHITYTYKLSQ